MLHPLARDECPEVGVRPMGYGDSYAYRIGRQVLRECAAWSRDQVMPVVIAVISAWAAIYFGLVPSLQTRAAYEAYLLPFVPALVVYLIVQIVRAPVILDRAQRERIRQFEALTTNDAAIDLEERKLRLKEREIEAIEHQTEEAERMRNETAMRDLRERGSDVMRQFKAGSELRVVIQTWNPSEGLEASPLSNTCAIRFEVSISNSGAPTVVRDWELQIGGKQYQAATIRLDANGSLLVKPLETGGHRVGQVWFVIRDIPIEQVRALKREQLILTFCNVKGQRLRASYT